MKISSRCCGLRPNSALLIANVTFEPGCRNSWHKHAGGQILLVTGGRGYCPEWAKPARELHPGNVVNIPADVKHWHGAARDSGFVHQAIEVHSEKGPVNGEIVNLPVGNTEVAANTIQKLTRSDIFRIDSVKAYPEGYQETTEVAKEELHDLKERIESRKGLRQLSYMKEMKMGNGRYEMITL